MHIQAIAQTNSPQTGLLKPSGAFRSRLYLKHSSAPQKRMLSSYFYDDGHGDYNRSYDSNQDDFDYADYSTDKTDNNFLTQKKKTRKSEKQIIEDILNRWD